MAKRKESKGPEKLVSILVIGDPNVGKTSLISALVSHHFNDRVPKVLHEIQIPGEESQHGAVTTITDTSYSTRPDDVIKLREDIQKCKVIVLVYDISQAESFTRTKYWIQRILEVDRTTPVILVGNKSDLVSGGIGQISGNETSEQSKIRSLIKQFDIVEAGITCSAKAFLHVELAFYMAQKAVLFPIGPLYSTEKKKNVLSSHINQDVIDHKLMPKFKKALTRIFRLFDVDRDNALNDSELNSYQMHCFDIYLQPDDISALKSKILKDCPDGVLSSRGILLKGFLYLHQLYIEKGRPETCWEVLDSIGYDSNLNITVPPEVCEVGAFHEDQSFELSSSSIDFFTKLFYQFDKDKDGILKKSEIDDIFSICPLYDDSSNRSPVPWNTLYTPSISWKDDSGSMTLHGWISQWSLLTLVDPSKVLEYLFYFGYADTKPAIDITKRRKALRNQSTIKRKAVRCFLLGSSGSGKTSLVKTFLKKDYVVDIESSKDYYVSNPLCVANNVQVLNYNKNTTEKYLVLVDTPEFCDDEQLSGLNNDLENLCDVVCFVFDPLNPSLSLNYIRLAQSYVPDHIPCLYVATKHDQLSQEFYSSSDWLEMVKYCSSLNLDAPLFVSNKTKENLHGESSLFTSLVQYAQYPVRGRPLSEEKRAELKSARNKKIFFGCSFLVIGGVFAAFYNREKLFDGIKHLRGKIGNSSTLYSDSSISE